MDLGPDSSATPPQAIGHRPPVAWLAASALLLALGAAGCLDPEDRRPGLRLSGDVVTDPVDDWSFTDAHPEIYIEVRTPYLLPHSVTIVCATLDGQLYVGARNPTEKRWVAYVDRDPDVRLEIGERVYERRLAPVDDPERVDAVFRAYAAKYGWPVPPADARPPWRVFAVVARD